ncbi:MAG: bifunctional alpha,alpha-trehalose-phosphate synthase (UDP-forming)/trehalose-phosphatase [Polyangiales bacterium]
MPAARRILLVSNRLPVTVSAGGDAPSVERSTGGLATGLSGLHDRGESLWIGWPGELPKSDDAAISARFEALRLATVSLTAEDVARFYEGYCNGVLWPLFHSLPDQLPFEDDDFPAYERVNERFADAVAARYRPGDVVWVHDYQLMLLPRMLRARIPDAAIGFFLHIPFPPADTFRTLPARDALLEGVLGADLVGFHTAAYLRNFAASVTHVLGASVDVDRLSWQGRAVGVGIFPMGVDARAFQKRADSAPVAAHLAATRAASDERLLVGIDRLDYTKGIPRRLLAYERMLTRHPELRGRVRMVQVAVPSRTAVDAYAGFRQQVDQLVGRINGRFGTATWAPVHYVYRGLSEDEVSALYRAADVLLVTPIRDGMNLVAKEFVASRSDGGGVLVLSEFAGAASELAEAVMVNPYDVEGSARAYHRALTMPEPERRARMRSMRRRVFAHDGPRWSEAFLDQLARSAARREATPTAVSRPEAVARAEFALHDAARLVLLLDYDGTLVRIAATPELATPDDELVALLARLAARPGTEVHVVSGRSRDEIEQWFGHLPISLHAEHGQWSRAPGGQWSGADVPAGAWYERAAEILEDFAARTPGSLVERKRSGLAWHYRMCDPEYGAAQANELKVHLTSLLSNAPVEILSGDKVVELRPHGANKGRAVAAALPADLAGVTVAAFGDDTTDEDLFAAVPPSGWTFRVGNAPSRARLRLASYEDVRAMLERLAPAARSTPTPPPALEAVS